MGLNARDMQLHLCRVLQVAAGISYTFIQRHPLVSGVLLVITILYIFISYIYNLLVYMSPFLVCTAIVVTIFWSSEQNLLIYVNKEEKKREEERVEPKYPKIPKYGRRDLLYKYPSQNATSRRRNFTGRKLDVYGGLEEKAKDLSSVFRNEFTRKNSWCGEAKYIMTDEGSLDYELSAEKNEAPTKQTLHSEPSMRDLVIYGDECGGPEEEKEKRKDEKEAQEDRNKGVELKEDDQRNLMDLGLAEMDRNKRLESLIARRRARKLLKLHIENGLIDSDIPREIAPLFIAKANPFDSPRDFEGIDDIEMPGSAPSGLRSPFDIPYDPNEEKPNLKGDSFDEEFTSHQKDMQFCRHESFHSFPFEPWQDLAYLRVRRGMGNRDWFEQLTSKEGSEITSKVLSPVIEREETKHEEDGERKTETAAMKDEELENSHATKSISDHTSEPDLTTKMINVERDKVLVKQGPTIPKPRERVLNFPMFSTNATNINDSLYESFPSPVDRNQENMLFTGRRISHTPSHSIASDLQVEVSEVGSPTLTVDESHETNTNTDGESVVYDGDIDKDITSGSDDMWGASLHSRRERGISEHDISDVNNWRDIASPFAPQNIDEENAADVSSMSSRSDMSEDTPTNAINSDRNIFGNVKDFVGETDAHHPTPSSDVSTRWKRLMYKSVNHLPPEAHSEQPEELSNLSENMINKAQVINDINNSATIEQDNTHGSESNEGNTSVVQQEVTDDTSISSGSSSSPRSVLPQNIVADEVSASAYNQEMQIGVQQSNMEVMPQATLNGEGPLDTMPQNIQLSMDDASVSSGSSSSPRSVLPQNTIADEVSSSTYNQEMQIGAQQSNMEVMPQATLNGEGPLDTMTQNIQLSMDDASISSGSSSSSRSVLPQNTMADEVLSSAYNQEMQIGVQQSYMEVMPQATLNGEGPLDPQNIQLSMDDASISSGSSSSPRSVLPQNTIADEVSSSAYNQEMQIGVRQSNMEVMPQATLNGEGPLDTMPQNIQLSMDDPIVESHNSDFRHFQEWTYCPENSIDESNMSSKMDDAEVYNKEDEEKLKNDENKFTPLNRQDATAEPQKEVEMMLSEDMNEKSRELFDDKEPLNSIILESTSEVHRENEDKSQTSMRQEHIKEPFTNAEVMDTSSANHLEGEQNDFNKNEAILSPNHSTEEVNYLQNESKQVVEDHMEKEKLERVEISEDSPLPMVPEVTNAEEELNKNEAMVLSESARESNEVSNIAHMKEPEQNDSSNQKESTDLVE